MPKLYLLALNTEDPGSESPSETRARLKTSFPPGAVRRMTQLGMLTGHCLAQVPTQPEAQDATLIYLSRFGEGRALEDFLASFPAASPTGFQTSIHPSGAQQSFITRKQPVDDFIPLSGSGFLAGQGLVAALLARTRYSLLCGGEECGTWLAEKAAASDRTFAFACSLEIARPEGESPSAPLAELELQQDCALTDNTGLSLPEFFTLLHTRQPWQGVAAPGWSLRLHWTGRD